MDNEDFVSYEIAQALKKAGFDLTCDRFWYQEFANSDNMTLGQASADDFNNDDWDVLHCSAPTLAQAQKWLREEKGIAVNIQAAPMNCELWYSADIYSLEFEDVLVDGGFPFTTYESALSAGIGAALKLIEEGEE